MDGWKNSRQHIWIHRSAHLLLWLGSAVALLMTLVQNLLMRTLATCQCANTFGSNRQLQNCVLTVIRLHLIPGAAGWWGGPEPREVKLKRSDCIVISENMASEARAQQELLDELKKRKAVQYEHPWLNSRGGARIPWGWVVCGKGSKRIKACRHV